MSTNAQGILIRVENDRALTEDGRDLGAARVHTPIVNILGGRRIATVVDGDQRYLGHETEKGSGTFWVLLVGA